jgi:HEAT repeats
MKKNLWVLLVLVLLPVFSASLAAQEDKFTYLIENGARMTRENQVDKVLDMIRELPLEKKSDFRIKVIENFANFKGYAMTRRREYGERWKLSYNSMILSGDKSATPILVEFLKDENHYVRDRAAVALGYIGDERALEDLNRVSDQDEKGLIRRRAQWAHDQIGAIKCPEKSEEGATEMVTVTGSRYEPMYYHKPDCRRVTGVVYLGAKREISKKDALRQGYGPCPECMGGK